MASEIDERFEFDAPRFYNFHTMTSDCSPAEAWFDTAPEGPGKRPAACHTNCNPEAAEANREPFKNLQTGSDAAANKQPKEPAKAVDGSDAEVGPSKKATASNIVTSWGDATRPGIKRTRAHVQQQQNQQQQGGARTSGGSAPAAPAPAPAAPQAPAAASNGAGPSAPPPAAVVAPSAAKPAGACSNKARRVSAAQSVPLAEPHVEAPVTRSMSRLLRQAFTPIPERKAKHFRRVVGGGPPRTRNARTAAKAPTPAHRRTLRSGAGAGARLHAVLAPKISRPPRSTKPLTLPEDIELATSKRAARGAKPRDQAPAASPFRSLAEKVLDFQSRTPQRFRVQPKGCAAAVAAPGTAPGSRGGASGGASRGRVRPQQPQQPQITEAKTPVLWTSTRSRPRRFKTHEEEEEEELEREREAAFRARPVDPAVLSGAQATARKAPDMARRAPTEPKPFSLAVDQRARSRSRGRPSAGDSSGEGAAAAHEAPPARTRLQAAAQMRACGGRSILDGGLFGASILGGTAGGSSRPTSTGRQRDPSAQRERAPSAQRARPSLTIPQSPLLRTKARHHSPPPQRDAPKAEFRARPAPAFDTAGASAIPYVPPKEPTQPEPFRLKTDDRHRQHEVLQQARLEEERLMDERRRRVSARPLPLTTDMPGVPPRPAPKELTLPVPYRLRSEARHAEAVQKHEEQLAKEEEQRRHAAEFKARPMWAGKQFTVHESNAPLTVPDDVVLATEERVEPRGEFDRAVAEKTRAQEEERQRLEELKRKRVEEEDKEYRRSLRFKARPMPKFDQPFFSEPSNKPLTNPQTPNFASKKRAKGNA